MIKYTLTKLNAPAKCWYEISGDIVNQLFEDGRYIGEICHLFNESENAESLIQTEEELKEALSHKAIFILHSLDVHAQQKLFQIKETVNND